MEHFVISAPPEEISELNELRDSLKDENSEVVGESKAFDGATVVQLVVPITIGTIAVVRTWIDRRFRFRGDQTITYKGIKIKGHSAKDALEILDKIQENLE